MKTGHVHDVIVRRVKLEDKNNSYPVRQKDCTFCDKRVDGGFFGWLTDERQEHGPGVMY
jgi:hypothetical protein